MAYGLKRQHLQALADAKLKDAMLLQHSGRSSSAYYLAGYAVEFGLKACVARNVAPETIPDPTLLKNVMSHDFPTLIGLAGLRSVWKSEQDADSVFAANWGIVSEWKPEVRYETRDSVSAMLLIQAITHTQSGVLKWIKANW